MNNEITQEQPVQVSMPPVNISPREKQIIELLADGLNSGEIAGQLHISLKTVEAHRHNILKKTGCKNSAHLTLYSVRTGLIK